MRVAGVELRAQLAQLLGADAAAAAAVQHEAHAERAARRGFGRALGALRAAVLAGAELRGEARGQRPVAGRSVLLLSSSLPAGVRRLPGCRARLGARRRQRRRGTW